MAPRVTDLALERNAERAASDDIITLNLKCLYGIEVVLNANDIKM